MTAIERSVSFELVRAEDNGDGLTLDGYAAVWDSPTRIDSWEGQFEETMQRGAFRKTIREQTPVLQFDHGRHAMIGSIPIGRIDALEEDERGLHVVARLSDNWLIDPVRTAIADKAVKGMSFRFEVVRESWADSSGNAVRDDELMGLLYNPGERGPLQRTLVEVKCHELGPVVFPAYKDTSVGVRAREVAEEILGDGEMRRQVLADLMADPKKPKPKPRPKPKPYGGKFTDEEVRDVALALLFGDNVRDDAPLADEEHPSATEDAPLQDEHPSQAESHVKPSRVLADAGYRAEYLALILKGADRYDQRT